MYVGGLLLTLAGFGLCLVLCVVWFSGWWFKICLCLG